MRQQSVLSRPMALLVVGVVMFSAVAVVEAQITTPVTPSQPTSFKKRDLGTALGSTSPGVSVGPRNPRPGPTESAYKTVQYIGIATARNWTNDKGKTIRGILLAFENGPKEKLAGPLTLISDGKIRLLRTGANKPSIVSINMLSPEDQKFVRHLDAGNRNQGKAQKADPAESEN